MKKQWIAVILLITTAILALFLFAAVWVKKDMQDSQDIDEAEITNDLISPSHSIATGSIKPQVTSKTDFPAPIIKDNIQNIDEVVLRKIAQNYFMVFDFGKCLSEADLLDYGEALCFFTYGGVYRLNPINPWERPDLSKYYDAASGKFALPAEVADGLISEGLISRSEFDGCITVDGNYIVDSFFWDVRPELHKFFDKKTWMLKLPAQTVDDYLLGKFYTVVNRSKLPDGVTYDKSGDSYDIKAFTGAFYYDLDIDEQVIVDGDIIRFTCTATLDEEVQSPNQPAHRVAFTVSFANGEYRYLSVELLDNG